MRAWRPIFAVLVLTIACAGSEDGSPSPEATGDQADAPALVQEETSLMWTTWPEPPSSTGPR
jgi:hypothetical protein